MEGVMVSYRRRGGKGVEDQGEDWRRQERGGSGEGGGNSNTLQNVI